MSIEVISPRREEIPDEIEPDNYLNVAYGVLSWLLTKDHKRIAILYLLSVTVMFFVGGFAISIARLNLLTPEGRWSVPTPTTGSSRCTA